MENELLSPTYLFHFAVPCHHMPQLKPQMSAGLDERYRLPVLSELNGKSPYADVRVGWHEQGLALRVEVQGKRQPPWCRESRIEDSDGLEIVIDTRATHNVHRAGRFCHRFVFTALGSGRNQSDPLALSLPIARAREPSKLAGPGSLFVRSNVRKDGYVLEAVITANALAGYEPREHPRLGFAYMVLDRELGRQSLAMDPELPVMEDPSLWSDLELVT